MRFLLLFGLIGAVSGQARRQVDRGVCNSRGRLVGGDCVCHQFYTDATSGNPAFEIVKSGDGKVFARSAAHGGLVISSVINDALIFTKTDDGALRLSDGAQSDQPIRGQCLVAPQLNGNIVFGNCNNDNRINDVQFPANQLAGMLVASSVQWQNQCAASNNGCSILNHGGATVAAEQNRMIFYNNHGPVARVFQQQRLLEDQRCAVFDRTLGSTTTTTTANRVLTTTVTQTTHTANFSDYHVDITSLMSTQLSLSTTVAALTTRLSTVEQANDELTSTVSTQTEQIATGQSTNTALRSSIIASLASLPAAVPATETNCEAGLDGAVPAVCQPSIDADGMNIVLTAPGGTVRVDTDTCGSVSVCETLMALDTLKRALGQAV